MIITNSSNINIYNDYKISTDKSSFKGGLTSVVDTFTRSQDGVLQKALSKLNKFNWAEYNALSNEEIQLLRTEVNKIGKIFLSDIKNHHYAAESIKQAFDKEYGVGNYVVVAIGRSLSSVAKLLSLKIGEDSVKNIPLSGLSRFSTKDNRPFEKFATDEEKQNYKDYLESVGLSRENIENSGKQYIILDYAYTGRSLKNAYKILTSDFFWGNKKRNVSAVSVADILPLGFISDNLVFKSNLLTGTYKIYSFVDHLLNLDKLSINKATDCNSFAESDEEIIKKHRLFGFALLDSEKQGVAAEPYKNFNFVNNLLTVEEQKRPFWKSSQKQFKEDVFVDLYEIEKAILKNKDDVEMLRTLLNFKKKLNKKISLDTYYSELRPKILEVLEKSEIKK